MEGSTMQVPGTPATVAPAQPREVDDHEARQEAAVEAYARDHEGLDAENERDALDYLLAPKPSRQYDVWTDYETEDGPRRLNFVIRGMDGRRIDAIEQANVSSAGQIDQITANCQLVAEACVCLESKSGRRTALSSDEFLTLKVPDRSGGGLVEQKLASPADALEKRFATQLGLVSGVAREVRRVSGFDPDRVGQAQRRLVSAAGNS